MSIIKSVFILCFSISLFAQSSVENLSNLIKATENLKRNMDKLQSKMQTAETTYMDINKKALMNKTNLQYFQKKIKTERKKIKIINMPKISNTQRYKVSGNRDVPLRLAPSFYSKVLSYVKCKSLVSADCSLRKGWCQLLEINGWVVRNSLVNLQKENNEN